jgi:hypothetical protein
MLSDLAVKFCGKGNEGRHGLVGAWTPVAKRMRKRCLIYVMPFKVERFTFFVTLRDSHSLDRHSASC